MGFRVWGVFRGSWGLGHVVLLKDLGLLHYVRGDFRMLLKFSLYQWVWFFGLCPLLVAVIRPAAPPDCLRINS